MKYCQYCGTQNEDQALACTSCGRAFAVRRMKYCEACGTPNDENATACVSCGRPFITRKMKYCKHCGAQIDEECIICPICGKQVEEIRSAPVQQPQIVINNSNQNQNVNTNINGTYYTGRMKNKWVAFFLCLFLGVFGAHKFYEGRAGAGILYLLTMGLFGIGWLIDCIILLFKPNPYYV